MPRINWLDVDLSGRLRSGEPSSSISESLGCTLGTVYRRMRDENLDGTGNFILRPGLRWNKAMRERLHQVLIAKKDIASVAGHYGITHRRMASILRAQKFGVTLDLTKNTSSTVRRGRMAEEFVKSQPEFIIKRDVLETDGAVYGFDLVIQGYGAVDVKSTELRSEKPRGYASVQKFFRFSTSDVDKRTRFLFLVGYEGRRPTHLYIVPKEEFKGVSTIQIFTDPPRGKWSSFLHRTY